LRETLYKNIFEFVKNNSGLIFQQFKRLGFSADWDRSVFSLDKKVTDQVFETFKKMESEGLVYRDGYIVNYCTHCGTSLAELEVVHETKIEPLYYIKYGPLTLATVRPETKFGDTALAVNPKDKRYSKWVGKEIEIEGLLGKTKIKVISDSYVDKDFGTGVVKITPAHDPNDFAVWQRHKDEIEGPISVIDMFGRLTDITGKYSGMKVNMARELVVKDLDEKGLIEKIDKNYEHNVTVCYKCKHTLEPLIIPNWFIKVKDLKAKVKEVVENDEVKFFPKKFKRHMLSWLDVMHDWPISRQIVWGIRIPVWYEVDGNKDLSVTFIDKSGNKKYGRITEFDFDEVLNGLQSVNAPANSKYIVSETKPDGKYLPETDTFDTWFSSSQWPIVTLKDNEFKTRFPTDMIGTLSEILKFWISRMILFSIYLKNEIPFKNVYLWSMVADTKGIKMSKSKNNVVNPIEIVDKYGADALRMSLLYGTPSGSKIIFGEEKVKGMRNFSNKIWNSARFLNLLQSEHWGPKAEIANENVDFEKRMNEITLEVTKALEKYQLNIASEVLYEEFWHWFCDICIEKAKLGIIHKSVMINGLKTFLKLLHPFMPFITEACWHELGNEDLLITSKWPMMSNEKRTE